LWVWQQLAKAPKLDSEAFMKTILALSFMVFLTAASALGQTQQTEADNTRTEPHHQLSYGWLGLAGLLGLLGLRRPKSIEHQRMAAKGVRVSTVPVHLPEHS
jgi:MYXO-CTERM domain-containing protein